MFSLSSDFIMRQVRVALFALAGFLASKGISEAGTLQTIAGGAMLVFTWAWSLWGNRLIAKVNEVAGNPGFIVLAPAEVATSTPNTSVLPIEQTQVIAPAPVAKAAVAGGEASVQSSTDVKIVSR